MTDTGDRWFVTEHGAVLYGDDTGGATIAGIANHWNQHDERNEALTKLNAFVRDLATQLAAARPILNALGAGRAVSMRYDDELRGAARAWLAGTTESAERPKAWRETEPTLRRLAGTTEPATPTSESESR